MIKVQARLLSSTAATLLASVFVASALVLTAGTSPAVAGSSSPGVPTPSASSAPAPTKQVLEAMRRDLGRSATEVGKRDLVERDAALLAPALRHQLGAAFAGVWITPSTGVVHVGIAGTTSAHVSTSRAVPTAVAFSLARLDQAKSRLDQGSAPRAVTGWYVDLPANRVVVTVQPGGAAAGAAFVRDQHVVADIVRVRVSSEQPRPLYDIRGGDAYYIGGSRCSMGFAVVGGFLTAGHCEVLTSGALTGSNGVALGTWGGATFPGPADDAWVRTNGSWSTVPEVTGLGSVRGSQEAVVGASICRSGSTTGVHCGTVQSKNQTVNYPQGTVNGLTRTNACAEPGDSGGSWMTGDQAQGMTSGGSGNCTSGGTTYFQPVNPSLARYGLSLRTAASPFATAFQANTTNLWSVDGLNVGDWRLGMMPGTSPSITRLAGGGYEIAFQANTGNLWTVGTAGNRDWGLGMRAGTSPAIAGLTAGGFEVAFQANTTDLWVVGSGAGSSTPGNLRLGMMDRTSPAIARLTGGGYQVAFQANTSNLWTIGTAGTRDWGLGMRAGTSPAIAGLAAGGFEVAFQANTSNLWTVGQGGGSVARGDWGLGMAGGTSPAIAALAGGGHEVAFQANTGNLWTVGQGGGSVAHGDWRLGMASGTSPAIAALAGGGHEVAFQANTSNLWTVGEGGGSVTSGDRRLGMRSGTSPGIS